MIVIKIIKAFLIIGFPLLILSLARILYIGFLPVMALHLVLYAFLVFCYFRKESLSSTFLSSILIFVFFLIAMGAFFTHRLSIYMTPGTLLSLSFAALLLSRRTSFLLLGLQAIILVTLSILYSKSPMSLSLFDVTIYCGFSSFVIFAISKVKDSYFRLIESLEKKEERVREINNMLSLALESKSKFLALMSHEIKTPLNGILLASEHLQDFNMSQEQKELFEIIDSSNKSVQSIINNILDLTKSESGKIILEEKQFNLKNLAQKIIKNNSLQAKKKGIELHLDFKCNHEFFVGDETRLEQIIVNLISNALKFTMNGLIKLDIKENKEGLIELEVSDTGIGIEESRIDAIFNEFVQEDNSTTRLFGGTGLGLTITKQLVDLMEGTIQIKSQKGVGSRFIITLPLRLPSKIVNEVSHITSEAFNLPEAVIIFEDNPINADLLRRRLEKFGIKKISMASNGLEGLEIMKEECFDLVFMDGQMPVLNGIEATKRIREERIGKNSREIVIIGLSANSFEEDKLLAIEAGMNDYLAKPVKKSDLQNIFSIYF